LFGTLLRLAGAYRVYERYLTGQIRQGEFPEHIGVILDGNRRWARARSYPEWIGHRAGARSAQEVLQWCHDLGIKTITLYVLSTENLLRPDPELEELMHLFEEKLRELLNDERIHRYRIRVKTLGEKELLPVEVRSILDDLEESTKGYDSHFLNIAIAYGGRHEILDVVRKVGEKISQGSIKLEDVNEETFGEYLYTSHLPNPEPDLIIRTSGEERLSGFLLWQSAYSELVFLDVFWPDFRKIDLMRAIRTYQKRKRRFGK